MRLSWVQPDDLLRHGLVQATAEGIDVSQLRSTWLTAGGSLEPSAGGISPEPASPELLELAGRLLEKLDRLIAPYTVETDDLNTIRASWSPLPELGPVPTGEELYDRLHGAWLGRAAGCLLGKPVEKIPRRGIREILQAQGRWPLNYYFSGEGLPADVAERWPWNRASRSTSLLDVIDGMPEDDDTNYSMLALSLLERYGPGFSSDDVATLWLAELPAARTFTAERVAYRNLLEGLAPPETARVRNPYREWIGAQIRTDLYGWTRPGQPYSAAELAWKDARVSHTRNGIYGAMFAAAMGAAAMVASDVGKVLACGLAVIPTESRLAQAVRLAIRIAEDESDFERGLDRLQEAYGDLHWVHSVNNAALAAFGLLAGSGDFEASVCLTVSGGWDTDSNGATVGGVVGALNGAPRLPARWVEPLRNRIASSLCGFDGAQFDELARRTAALVHACR